MIKFRVRRCTCNMWITLLEKWFPLQVKRGHSSYFWSFQNIIERRGGQNKNNRPSIYPRL